ncbi:MAG TPA: outer membrane protein assembly factor BamA, partial [Porticoccaceae bacterium]|nr:outer membrane protein assembly factor BamA [Porticoccaceae bacterium]
PASTDLIEHSKVRLERLGHFKEVKVDTREVPGTDDQVDVFYAVEEQPSGSIGASFGVAQGSGIILGGNIQENNFLGTGNAVSFGVSRSRYRESAIVSLTDPYFTKDGVSAGYRFAFTSTDYGDFDVAEYTSDSFS